MWRESGSCAGWYMSEEVATEVAGESGSYVLKFEACFFLEVNFPHASCALENARLNRGADARATCVQSVVPCATVESDVAYGASFSAAPDDLLEGVVRAAPFSCLWSDM